jgi:hypothetical protein
MKKYLLKSILAICWLVISIPLMAGPGDPPGEGDPPFVDPTPIDNYVWILLLVALIVGSALIYRRKLKTV